MSKEINVKYYQSELIPSMLFDSKEDADEFDSTLQNYINDPLAKDEFYKAEEGYPSYYAIVRDISLGQFHFKLCDLDMSSELIAAAENMVDQYGDEHAADDPYTPLMEYLFNQFHPGIREKINL